MKRIILSGLVLAALNLPMPALAQTSATSEATYREYLLSLIDLLQQQIALLQPGVVDPITDPIEPISDGTDEFTSFLFTDADDVLAWYEIDESDQAARLADATHRRYFTRFFEIIPDEYDDYFVDLLVFEERESNDFDGFVETVPPYREDTWRFAINESMFDFSLTSDVVEELFVHEFAHIVSYAGINGVPVSSQARCHEWFDEFGCPPGDAYLLDFMDKFWTDSELDQLVEDGDTERIWSAHARQERFTSDYASTDPAEDFAESFTYFVLEEPAANNSIAADKIDYFYDFDELVDLRDEIRKEL